MSQAVRVSNGNEWCYVPAEGKYRSRLERFAKLGMSQVSDGTVRLRSDAGPIMWDLIVVPNGEKDSIVAKTLKAMDDDCIRLANNEKLCFGKKDGVSYNDFVDLSLVKDENDGNGLKVGIKAIEDGQVLLTAWPKARRLIPAKATVKNRRVWLELAEPQKKGQRCFVLDEDGESVLTASFETNGDDAIGVICPSAIDSWLMAVGSEAVMAGGRYEVLSGDGQGFIIRDMKAGREYSGKFFHDVADPASIGFERMRMERLLASKGIGSILPSYQLRKRGEGNEP
jgi:hypothetical protein